MKHLTMFAVLIALAGGTAFAQQDMGNSSVSGATFTTGIVESIDASQLTLRDQADRVTTILIEKGTVGAMNHPVGSRVRVNFHTNESGQSVADEIQGAPGEVQAAEAEVHGETVTSDPATTASTHAATTHAQKPNTATEPTYEEDSETEATSTLPRTASSHAAIGLLGLLSLCGALVIRVSR